MPDATNELKLATQTVVAHLLHLGIAKREDAEALAAQHASPHLFASAGGLDVRIPGIHLSTETTTEERLHLLARKLYAGAPGHLKREAAPPAEDRVAAKLASGHIDYSI